MEVVIACSHEGAHSDSRSSAKKRSSSEPDQEELMVLVGRQADSVAAAAGVVRCYSRTPRSDLLTVSWTGQTG